MRLLAGSATDVGRVRQGKPNEDAVLVDDRLHLFAVADGMGGHRAGEVASATALEALRAAIAAGRPVPEAIASANSAVFSKAFDDPELRGMGTTITVAVAGTGEGQALVVGHVGDSRAYHLHDGELVQITEDHSLVEELVREGRLTPEQASVHPQRSIITRALGVDEQVLVDTYDVDLAPGDRILLCSDGLTSMVRPNDIARILRREDDPTRAAEALVDAANAAGGEDNVTAVVLAAADDVPTGIPDARAGADTMTAEDLTSATPAAAPDAVDTGVVSVVDAAGVHEPRADDALPDELPAPIRLAPKGTARRILRVVLWLLPVLVVVAVAIGAVGWYARKAFFVAFDGGQVTLFQGRPGGVLGFNPTVKERTKLTASDLSPADRGDVRARKRFTDEEKARRYVAALRSKAEERAAVSATTTTLPATTTTLPPNAPLGP
ncbi:MAG TPA: Stp1/IreP family PP2C-type Ser/Thr phosphatase [Acidimicrobiia bacterium]|nr:Stp1/IreP family PP2C-type Ser/Thr phosphatase [Acidimicrobiia bacterium]